MTRLLVSALAGFLLLAPALGAAEAKKLLVVSATAGARHASIPNGEKMLRDLAARSNGQFSLVLMSDAADYPFGRVPGAGRGAIPGFPGQVPTATAAQSDALFLGGAPLAARATAVTAAQADLLATTFSQPTAIAAKVDALASAEANLALGRAAALAQIQASANRLAAEQVQALAGARGAAAGRGGAGPAADNGPIIAKLFQEYLSPAALRNYDGVIFLNSTGLLPFPDRDAFLKWVSDGHAVIGIHAAMDTGYYTPDSYLEMLSGGARYATTVGGSTTARKVYRLDASHPATRDWPDGLEIADEFFQFSRKNPDDRNTNLPGLDAAKVHVLLEVDLDGQRLPVAWTKMQGAGRVFYTSLGHRDDVMLPGTPSVDSGTKINPDPVSAAYQAHLLNGIRWALGLPNGSP